MSSYRLTRAGTTDRLVHPGMGAVHVSLTRVGLGPDGALPSHAHAYEESVYVLDGALTLRIDGHVLELGAGDGALIPPGMAHGFAGGALGARWVEAGSPPGRLEPPADRWQVAEHQGPAVEGPYAAHFRAPPDAADGRPTGALLVFGGSSLRMLVDARIGAALHTLFIVRFEPGAALGAHDHPFEEAYLVLEGRIDAICEGERITLGEGDALWTSVGCIHGFENPYDVPVRWLETQAPQPPARYGFRFPADWPAWPG
jgi:quercetin dioxygenase-like cupin family protein